MTRPLRLAACVLLTSTVSGIGAGAQIVSRTTPPPDRTAAGTDWYAARAPIYVVGDTYEPAGASVFFDERTMVPVARFGEVPVYEDATLEPHSLVFVPIGRGLVQPYERRRAGDLAGTTGSRPPSFPVASSSTAARSSDIDASVLPLYETGTAGASVESPGPRGWEDAEDVRCEPGARSLRWDRHREARPVAPAAVRGPLTTAIKPTATRGIWVAYEGSRWESAGPAVLLDTASMKRIGTYAGGPVYQLEGIPDRIYLPPVEGLVAPYRRAID